MQLALPGCAMAPGEQGRQAERSRTGTVETGQVRQGDIPSAEKKPAEHCVQLELSLSEKNPARQVAHVGEAARLAKVPGTQPAQYADASGEACPGGQLEQTS